MLAAAVVSRFVMAGHWSLSVDEVASLRFAEDLTMPFPRHRVPGVHPDSGPPDRRPVSVGLSALVPRLHRAHWQQRAGWRHLGVAAAARVSAYLQAGRDCVGRVLAGADLQLLHDHAWRPSPMERRRAIRADADWAGTGLDCRSRYLRGGGDRRVLSRGEGVAGRTPPAGSRAVS